MKYDLLMTDEFEDWIMEEPAKSRVQIARRMEMIRDEGYFGDHKRVRENIWELRWDNGRRVYYCFVPVSQVLLLIGGNKNGQTKDIHEAEKIYREWVGD
jgi:putative addiction module killer protein